MKRSLSKKERLKKSDDFKRVLNSSLRASCQGARLAALSNSFDKSRLGVGLSKKFGNAVQRNRAKRQIREIFRLHKDRVKPGFDLVFLVYPGEVTFEERKKQFLSLLQRIGLETLSTQ